MLPKLIFSETLIFLKDSNFHKEKNFERFLMHFAQLMIHNSTIHTHINSPGSNVNIQFVLCKNQNDWFSGCVVNGLAPLN